jgi:hypothetical protein
VTRDLSTRPRQYPVRTSSIASGMVSPVLIDFVPAWMRSANKAAGGELLMFVRLRKAELWLEE